MTNQTLTHIELPIGTHAFVAEMISAKCTSEGIRNELLAMGSMNPYSMLEGDPHRLLVAETDAAAVRAIISTEAGAEPTPTKLRSRPQRIAALSLVAMFLGPLVVTAVAWVISAIF